MVQRVCIGPISDGEDGSRLQFSNLQEAIRGSRGLLYGAVHFILSPPPPPTTWETPFLASHSMLQHAVLEPLATGTGTENLASATLGIVEWWITLDHCVTEGECPHTHGSCCQGVFIL